MASYNVKGVEFESPYSNEEVIKILLTKKSDKGLSDFESSLTGQYLSRRALSPKQWPYAHKFALEYKGELAVAKMFKPVRLQKSLNILVTTISLNDKRIFNVKGQPVILSVATFKSKLPGTINITDSARKFENRKWYGRIQQEEGSVAVETLFKPSRAVSQEVFNFVNVFGADPEEVFISYDFFQENPI